tara:strand:+ start:372 stop:629 length:258 start_codon:yes stop_codon:yes gene_type:complete
MNINSDFSSFDENQAPSAEEVMAQGMGFIGEKLIEPMRDKLDTEDLSILALIGISFKIVADQATAYEKLQESELDEDKTIGFHRN